MSDPHTPLPRPGVSLLPSPVDRGRVADGRILFENWRGAADRPDLPPPAPLPPEQRVGFAVIGLGRLALGEILPAFAACGKARLAALVSGDADKARTVARQYGIPASHTLSYAEMRRLADLPDVGAVYVATPNGLHLDHVQAAASAGKHVLCEKPMANTSAEARAMIAACEAARVKLMIAYRCQYEPFNAAAIDLVRTGALGAVRLLEATNTQVQGIADQWRHKPELAGGGALPDIGLYCLNGVRAVLGEEPVEVFARIVSPTRDARFAALDETIAFMLRFPSGALANCAASYGAHETKDLRIRCERGWIELENAFAYRGQRLRVARRAGDIVTVEDRHIAAGNQFAREIDHFAECVREDRAPRTPGSEGLRDHRVMEAIYRSSREGMPVALPQDAAL